LPSVHVEPLTAAIVPGRQVQDSGETAVFNCTVAGSPLEAVTWFVNGRPLLPDVRRIVRDVTVLEVLGVGRQDQGMYQCFASGPHSETQAAAQLLLGGKELGLQLNMSVRYNMCCVMRIMPL